MKTSELIFVGIKGSVVALNRATGDQVWVRRLKSYDFVNVVLEDGRLFAATYGEIYCLDPVTGEVLWHNKLKGFGTGLVSIATGSTFGSRQGLVLSEKYRRDQEAANAAATTTT